MSRRWESLKKTTRERGYIGATSYLASKALRLVRTGKLQPPNTVAANLELWSRYDWSMQGEEWTKDSDWRNSLVQHVLEPNIPIGSRVLEIGPGGGRWTEPIVKRAAHVTVVDLTPECIQLCKEKFGGFRNISYFVNDGKDLSFISPNSIDRLWSFDVFVHIQSPDVENYIAQISAILVTGGRGIIHHSANGINKTGWRSDMTAQGMTDMCSRYGLSVLQQFDSWDGGRFCVSNDSLGRTTDIVTVFEKDPSNERNN